MSLNHITKRLANSAEEEDFYALTLLVGRGRAAKNSNCAFAIVRLQLAKATRLGWAFRFPAKG